LNHRATYSAEPPNTAFAIAYEKPTPSARTSTGNISALIRPPIEVYRLTIASAQVISTPAITGLVTPRRVRHDRHREDRRQRAEPAIIEVRRPMRSDSAPNTGCSAM
jgi:hypothetical protein